jgi:two-component system, OmpR family, response regulator ResD
MNPHTETALQNAEGCAGDRGSSTRKPRLRSMSRVLVVDDDETLSEVLLGYLQRAGHDPSVVTDGPMALAEVSKRAPELVVLDLMLPGIDGLEVCRRVRANHADIPVIMLTALGEAEDRIAGLEVGADDYITKPFSPRELVLRIDSVLRRSRRAATAPTVLTAGPVRVDVPARRATNDGRELALTVRELDLLIFLMSHPGQAFRRAELMSDVWGWTFADHSTVTVHVRRLREKIEVEPSHPKLIQTVWGIGYRFEPPDGGRIR